MENHIHDLPFNQTKDYRSMDYSEITNVVLSGGDINSLHSLAFEYGGQEVKYLLVHEGGQISDNVFATYKSVLDSAFPNNWKLSKGVRTRKFGIISLKIGALGAIPVAAALFLLAIFQHDKLMSALEAGIFLYFLFLVVLTGISNQIFIRRIAAELQSTFRNN